MKKRILAFCAVLVLLAAVSVSIAAGEMRASPTLASYSAKVTTGSGTGNIIITYDVTANTQAEKVGVSSIEIRCYDGSYLTTIPGTIENGLLITDDSRHRSSYTFHGTSGEAYYALVTVTATIDGVTDSRTITTNSATAR